LLVTCLLLLVSGRRLLELLGRSHLDILRMLSSEVVIYSKRPWKEHGGPQKRLERRIGLLPEDVRLAFSEDELL